MFPANSRMTVSPECRGGMREEQKELAEKIKALRAEIDKQNSQSMTTDMFISLVRKYTRARKLTPRMLNELIEKIEVFNAEKVDGVWEQRLRIHYNCVGAIGSPDLIPLPAPEVSVNTKKGRSRQLRPIHHRRMKLTKKDECSYSISNAIRTLAMVGVAGFEPAASWTRTMRDTKLRHTPITDCHLL